MTIQTEDYLTRAAMKTGKDVRTSNGWRALHTDFINNTERDGYHVTYVNGLDDPDNDPAVIAERTQQKIDLAREQELITKLKDDTITTTEIREFLKLKFVK